MIFNIVASTFIKAIQLNEHEKKILVVKLTPRLTGTLKINAVVGKISVSNLKAQRNYKMKPRLYCNPTFRPLRNRQAFGAS